MSGPGRYVLRPYAVDAICFLPEALGAAMDFCKDTSLVVTRAFEPDRIVALLASSEGVHTIERGDWIVRRGNAFARIEADQFWELYARDDAVAVSL